MSFLSGLTIVLTSFLGSGGVGYLNYYYLKNIDIINIPESDKDDKKYYVLLFSVLNFLYIKYAYIIYQWVSITKNIKASLVLLVFFILGYLIYSLILFPLFFKSIDCMINMIRKSTNKSDLITISPKESSLSRGEEHTLAYIYTLDDKFVECGYIEYWGPLNEENKQYVLCPDWDNNDKDFDINHIRKKVKNLDSTTYTDARIFLDIENNLKFYLFYSKPTPSSEK